MVINKNINEYEINELNAKVDINNLIAFICNKKGIQSKPIPDGLDKYKYSPCPFCGQGNHFRTFYHRKNGIPMYTVEGGCNPLYTTGSSYSFLRSMGYKHEEAMEQLIQAKKLKEMPKVESIYTSEYFFDETLSQESRKKLYLEQLETYINERSKKAGKTTVSYHVNLVRYLQTRGLPKEIIDKYKLGYMDNSIILPVTYNGMEITTIKRHLDSNKSKYINAKGTKREFCYPGLDKLISIIDDKGANKAPYIVVEGYFDWLVLDNMGFNAIATLGDPTHLADMIKFLGLKDKIITLWAMDNDARGKEFTSCLKEMGYKNHIEYVNGQEFKDISEFYQINGHEITKKIIQYYLEQLGEYMEDSKQTDYRKENSNIRYIEEFLNGISDDVNTEPISTGFVKLDKTLDGGLYEGLYILGAVSSLGKTTLSLQIVDQIAKQGHDVIVISLEMARSELIAKSISRNTYIITNEQRGNEKTVKTTREITNKSKYKNYSEEEIEVINKAIERYKDYAEHIIIHEGIGEIGVTQIKDYINKHIKETNKKPVVVIDYMQILAPYNYRLSDKQNMDKAVMELKRISRDFKIPILAISSFNRANYSTSVNMTSFKESGGIEYSSDVLIGLQYKQANDKNFDIEKAMRGSQGKRTIELKILKNRNGMISPGIEYRYNPKFNLFEEV